MTLLAVYKLPNTIFVVLPVLFVDYAIIAIDYIIAVSANFSLLLSEQNDILLNHFP